MRALRFLPALAGSVTVFLAGWMAKQLGGGRRAQLLASLATLVCPLYLLSNTMFQTVSFNQLAWVACCSIFIAILGSRRQLGWLLFGVALGIGLLTRQRSSLTSPVAWMAGLVAEVIVSPNLHWQMVNGWPFLEFLAESAADDRVSAFRFVSLQCILMGPVSIPLFVGGFAFLFSNRRKPFRALGWTALSVFVLLLVSGGKPYYSAPLYPLLFAAGSVVIDMKLSSWNRVWLRRGYIVALTVGHIWLLPIFLPVLPVEKLAERQDDFPHEDFKEMFGWEEMAQQVAHFYTELPRDYQEGLRVLTDNYGSAGAIDLFGKRFRIPAAISGRNSYAFWEQHPELDPLIVLGYNERTLSRFYETVVHYGVITNSRGIVNKEMGEPISFCTGIKIPAEELWQRLRHSD